MLVVELSRAEDTRLSLALRGWEPRVDDDSGGGNIPSVAGFEACKLVTSVAFPFPFKMEGLSKTARGFAGDLNFPTPFIPGEKAGVRDATLNFSFILAGEGDNIEGGDEAATEIVAARETRSSVVARRVFRGVDPEATEAADLAIRSCDAWYCKQISKCRRRQGQSIPQRRLDYCLVSQSGASY